MHRAWTTFSASQRKEIWSRWTAGESFTTIALGLKVQCTALLWHMLAAAGGIPPRPRCRRLGQLTAREREIISQHVCAGWSMRRIARQLRRAPSTISRELERNRCGGQYSAVSADERALQQALRPKRCKLALVPKLRALVAKKLRRRWSPQQIAGWLKLEYPRSPAMQISHETIYRSLFIQARGVLNEQLRSCLRTEKLLRRAPVPREKRRSRIPNAVSIRKRPAAVEDRAVPGHWEGDLIEGKRGSFVATLVERASRFVILVKVPSKHTEAVINALIRRAHTLPTELQRSLTWDRGTELSQHARFSLATDMAVYFCDPYSPWQRGSNENTNGLLRQYLPKGADLSQFSQAQLNRIARELNERPRETLGFRTPVDTLEQMLR
jgi:IS30 family transposase